MTKRKIRPEYIVPAKEPATDRMGPHPFETVPISEEEFYSLDHSMARFILPRLKRYRDWVENHGMSWGCFGDCKTGNPKTLREVNKMVDAFQIIASDDYWHDQWQEGPNKVINVGLKAFAKYYQNLWT
jgi:hypothetical protein